jgi:hypothetical protein
MLAVPIMAKVGQVISLFLGVRWTFEALGNTLNLNDLFANGNSALGPPLLAQYGDTFSQALAKDWAILGAMIVVFLALTCWILKRKSNVLV